MKTRKEDVIKLRDYFIDKQYDYYYDTFKNKQEIYIILPTEEDRCKLSGYVISHKMKVTLRKWQLGWCITIYR